MRRGVSISSLVLLFVVTACSNDPAGSAAGGEEDYTVQPTGGSATITVNGFTSGPTTKVFVEKQHEPSIAVSELQPGVPKAVSPGKYCVYARSENIETQKDCTLEVAAGNALTYTMGNLQITRSCSDDLFGVDLLERLLSSSTAAYVERGRQVAKTSAPLVHSAGDFSYALSYANGSLLQKISGRVEEGVTTTVDLCATAGMAALRLRPPAQRDLPSVTPAARTYTLALAKPGAGTTNQSAPFTELVKPLLLLAPVASDGTIPAIDVTARGTKRFELSPPGQPIKEIQLGRIDVEDVAVTMPDGTIKKVRGTYTIFEGGGFWISFIPTGHGIDVFPGHYLVTVEYKHPADGANMVDRHEVEIP